MAFSVQLAADCTSCPAPRTVLQAAIIRPPPISTTVMTLRNILSLLLPDVQRTPKPQSSSFRVRNIHAARADCKALNGDWGRNMRVGVVGLEVEIFGLVA